MLVGKGCASAHTIITYHQKRHGRKEQQCGGNGRKTAKLFMLLHIMHEPLLQWPAVKQTVRNGGAGTARERLTTPSAVCLCSTATGPQCAACVLGKVNIASDLSVCTDTSRIHTLGAVHFQYFHHPIKHRHRALFTSSEIMPELCELMFHRYPRGSLVRTR